MERTRWSEGPTRLDVMCGPGWAWIGLHSGDGLNRLHASTLLAMDALLADLRFSGVRRVALSAAGWMEGEARHFSAGADLHEVAALTPLTADAFARRGQRVMCALLWPGWRTLTILSGVVMGGGCDLALHGQERWAVGADAVSGRGGLRLAHPAAKHGILTGFGGTVRLPELLGARGASRLFAGLEHWNEQDALAAGAVQRVLRPDQVKASVLDWLQ